MEKIRTALRGARDFVGHLYWWLKAVKRQGLYTSVGVNARYGYRMLNFVDARYEWLIRRTASLIAVTPGMQEDVTPTLFVGTIPHELAPNMPVTVYGLQEYKKPEEKNV